MNNYRNKFITKSPFGDVVEYQLDDEKEINKLNSFVDNKRKNVVIQGLGFVGAAMAAAVSNAKNEKGERLYNVIGVDLPDERNYWKIALTNRFIPPVVSTDKTLIQAYKEAGLAGNLMATHSSHAYSLADIIVIDIHLDINKKEIGNVNDYNFTYNIYKKALNIVAENIKEETLVIVETTVPPGTTEKVIFPLFKEVLEKRGLDSSKFYLAHSYERVMPGPKYYDSIVNFYRVFSGVDQGSRAKAREFLQSFINTDEYPLTELHSTNASEIAKVLENSFRAMNIAFIKEWTDFAGNADVNLFEVIDAIRIRPTHKNIMQPGFGVGGYCLTKDALLADWAYQNHFNNNKHLDMSINAISVNDLMPDYTFDLLKKFYPSLDGKKIIIFGISYLSNVSDTRYSPTEYFYDLCEKENAEVFVHDTMVTYWDEKNKEINTDLNSIKDYDAEIAVFTVTHKEYLELSSNKILEMIPKLKLVIDANNVISDKTALELINKGISIVGVGKGHWNNINDNKNF